MSFFFCCCSGEDNRRDSSEFKEAGETPKPTKPGEPPQPPKTEERDSTPEIKVDLQEETQKKEQVKEQEKQPIKGNANWKPPEKPAGAPLSLTKEVQLGDKCRRSSVPVEAEASEGAYLLYDGETGAIQCHWSRSPNFEALSWMRPSVQIPNHLFNKNGGKQIFFSNTRDNESYKYFQGWVQFAKLSRKYGGKMMLFDGFDTSNAPRVQVLALEPIIDGSKDDVGKFRVIHWKDFNVLYDMKNVKAIAVVPERSTLITVGDVMDPEVFLQRGNGEGSASILESVAK